jgi:predicted RNA-binding protein YlqC (UPF0109 family)
MRELIELLAKALVDLPEAVEVVETEDGRGVTVTLKVAPLDMGRIIGKQGKIARAIRTLAKARGAKTGQRVNVEIVSE